MTYTQTNIKLQLDMQDGVVEGVARGSDGAERPFTGWLALIQTIDDLMAAASSR